MHLNINNDYHWLEGFTGNFSFFFLCFRLSTVNIFESYNVNKCIFNAFKTSGFNNIAV